MSPATRSFTRDREIPMNCEIAPKKSKLDLSSNSYEYTEETAVTPDNVLQNERYFTAAIIESIGKKQFIPEWQKTLGAKYIQWLDRLVQSLQIK